VIHNHDCRVELGFSGEDRKKRRDKAIELFPAVALHRDCPKCKGSGFVRGTHDWCPGCDGNGKIDVERVTGPSKGQFAVPRPSQLTLHATLRDAKKFAIIRFPVLDDKGIKDRGDWPEIRKQLKSLGENIYNTLLNNSNV